VSVPFSFRITASFSTIKQQCSKPQCVHLFARGRPTSRGWTEENISTSKAPSHTHLWTNGSSKVFTSNSKRFQKVCLCKLFQTPETNTMQTWFWPDFVQNYVTPDCSSISFEVNGGLTHVFSQHGHRRGASFWKRNSEILE